MKVHEETQGTEKTSSRSCPHESYEWLWERLVSCLDTCSLDTKTEILLEVALLLAAGLFEVGHAIGMATDPVCGTDIDGDSIQSGPCGPG